MEAVPRLPMIYFDLKQSTEATSFASLKRYIAECYHEDPETYAKEVYSFETLRNIACRPPVEVAGCNILKRYYCQLHTLQSRFPLTSERELLSFSWRDAFSSGVTQSHDIRYEMAVILYNYGAMHTQLAAQDPRNTDDGIKLVCTHYQCAAWAFSHIREAFPQATSGDLASDILIFMENLCLAQAQECILEKSLIDNRKPGIVAKVTAQIVAYYNQAYGSLLNISEDGSFAEMLGVGNKYFREYKAQIQFKISYLSCILFLYRGQAAEEQQKMGERVTFYQAAFETLEEAMKQSKGLKHQTRISEMCSFVMDVVEAKRKAGKNENEFIYHEEIPDISTFAAVQGANLVKGISFSVTDPGVAGEDIFKRLVPMKAHEASSVYSEEKANILRKVGARVQEKDDECEKFMASLNVDTLKVDTQSTRMPQGLVDRCAELNAKPNAIPDLISAMSSLAETCTDVESMLGEINSLLAAEEQSDQAFQQQFGMGCSSGLFVELKRERCKYQDAHSRAGESNDTLRKAMGLHLNNLKMLAQPLAQIQQSVPILKEDLDPATLAQLKGLLAKVKEMQDQRTQLHTTLRDAINNDDITSQVIAWGEKKLDKLFAKELAKHEASIALIDQNISAQPNILRALTECYARCAVYIKSKLDIKQKRDQFFSSLASSYDVYDDLLGKSSKGLEFYRKLQGNIQKLLARVRAAHDVQEEERQQRLKSIVPVAPVEVAAKPDGRHRLSDYLKNGVINLNDLTTSHPPSIRPSPLGSETTTSISCVTPTVNDSSTYQATNCSYNEPPPPYVPFNSQYSTANAYNYSTEQPVQYSAVDPNPTQYMQYSTAYQAPPPYNQYSQSAAINDPAPVYTPTYAGGPPAAHDSRRSPAQLPQHQQTQNLTTYTGQSAQLSQQQQQNQHQPQHQPQQHLQQQPFQQQQQQPQQQQPHHQQQQPQLQNQFQSPYIPNLYSASIATPHQQTHSTYDQSNNTNRYTHASSPNDSTSTGSGYTYNPYTGQYEPAPAAAAAAAQQFPPKNNQQAAPAELQSQFAFNPTNPTPWSTQTTPQNTHQLATDMNNMSISSGNQSANGSQYGQTIHSSSPYTTTTHSNYQITANVQYVTGYDQTASLHQSSYGGHPGYEFNKQSGVYQYGSGYQNDSHLQTAQNQYSQYTNAGALTPSNTTESNMIGVGGQSFANQYAVPSVDQQAASNTYSFDTQQQAIKPHTQLQQQQPHNNPSPQQWTPETSTGYDYNQSVVSHSHGVASQTPNYPYPNPTLVDQSGAYVQQPQPHNQQPTNSQQQQGQQQPQLGQPQQQHVQTHQEQAPLQQQQQVQPQQPAVPTKTEQPSSNSHSSPSQSLPKVIPSPKPQPSTNMDLLSGIDFTSSSISNDLPLLQPSTPKNKATSELDVLTPTTVDDVTDQHIPEESKPTEHSSEPDGASRKSSLTQQSPALSSIIETLDSTLNWDTASLESAELNAVAAAMAEPSVSVDFTRDPFEDPETVKWFHREVERYEKNIEAMNVKTLNGSTQLDSKWKELQDLLVKDESKRSTAVAKLFPDKNRTNDSIPYDHARVRLATTTDDYINACFVRELGPGCPVFVLAQTPMAHTAKDFWSMVWSQKSRVVVCLHGPSEMLDPFFPQHSNQAISYDDVSVTLVNQFDLSHCIERSFLVEMHGVDSKLEISIVQVKEWPKNSPTNVIGVAHNVIATIKQQMQANRRMIGPVILNCISGAERSGILALAVAAVLATCSKRPTLINAVDVWYRICSQRRGALRDVAALELSMQLVLNNAHALLNKRGIMTSYQMKNTQVDKSAELVQANDPFSDLDPLWKLK